MELPILENQYETINPLKLSIINETFENTLD